MFCKSKRRRFWTTRQVTLAKREKCKKHFAAICSQKFFQHKDDDDKEVSSQSRGPLLLEMTYASKHAYKLSQNKWLLKIKSGCWFSLFLGFILSLSLSLYFSYTLPHFNFSKRRRLQHAFLIQSTFENVFFTPTQYTHTHGVLSHIYLVALSLSPTHPYPHTLSHT